LLCWLGAAMGPTELCAGEPGLGRMVVCALGWDVEKGLLHCLLLVPEYEV
jgi:hypothetical protein